MAHADSDEDRPRLTARGRATKARILEAASLLTYEQGVAKTTLEDVMTASGTSKSQLYQHFADKDDLVQEVISSRASRVLSREARRLERLDSLRDLELWRDALIQRHALHGAAYGCEVGALAHELSAQHERARQALAAHFATWQSLLAAGIARLRASGTLRPEADPDALAVGLMAALQGGYLLSQTARDVQPMRTALDMAIAHVRSFAS